MEIQLMNSLMEEIRSEVNFEGNWMSLMDYAIKKGISLSTLRRHIKANKLTHKIENGRYLVLDEVVPPAASNSAQTNHQIISLQKKLLQLTEELQRTHEEIAELKTLIAFYEEQTSQQRRDS